MKQKPSVFLGVVFVVVAVVLHMALQRHGISFVPLPILASLLAVYILDRPLGVLVLLAIMFELLTTAPLGVVTAAVFAPYVIRRFFRAVEIDISFSFLLLVFGSAAAQVSLLVLPGFLSPLMDGFSLSEMYRYIPVSAWFLTVIASTVAAFTLLIVWYEFNPKRTYGS